MATEPWLLPEGVEEVLPPRARGLERLRRTLLDVFERWGYELVMPPFLEHLESLLIGTGRDLDLQTFKLIDQLSGRLLGVRADMTPQVARIDARHLRAGGVARLCYIGTVLRTLPDALGGSRSPVQVGAELYGHHGIESDCEVLCLMIGILRAAGLRDVHLDVGHVDVFRRLAREAALDPEQEGALHEALQRKARGDIDELLAAVPGRGGSAGARLAALTDLNGGSEVLVEARRVFAGAEPGVLNALDRLEALRLEMSARVPDLPVHFDLAELRGYRYHTGVVFAAFVPGRGQEVARGGRYDDVGAAFGGARRPATGFSTDLKLLAGLGPDAAGEAARSAIRAPWSADRALLALVEELRGAGERVVFDLPGQEPGPGVAPLDRRIVRGGDGWMVEQEEP